MFLEIVMATEQAQVWSVSYSSGWDGHLQSTPYDKLGARVKPTCNWEWKKRDNQPWYECGRNLVVVGYVMFKLNEFPV
jgi:hypothetical protein